MTRHCAVMNGKINFLIQGKRAVIDICTAYSRPYTVNNYSLRMHERGFVLENFYAAPQQGAVMATARRVCESIIDGTRGQNNYPNAPAGSFHESIGHDFIWNEVWIGNEDGLFSGVDREKKEHVILKAAAQRRTLDDLCLHGPGLIKAWKIVVPSNSDACRFEPALG